MPGILTWAYDHLFLAVQIEVEVLFPALTEEPWVFEACQ